MRKKKKDGSQSISNGDAVVSVTAERVCRRAHGAPGGLVRCFARTPFKRRRRGAGKFCPVAVSEPFPEEPSWGAMGVMQRYRKAPPIPAGSGT